MFFNLGHKLIIQINLSRLTTSFVIPIPACTLIPTDQQDVDLLLILNTMNCPSLLFGTYIQATLCRKLRKTSFI